MYRKILVALDATAADQSLLPHVTELAAHFKSHLLLMHVADGWAARHFDKLKLAESEEMIADRKYLEAAAEKLRARGLAVTTELALGDPPAEILKAAAREHCDLIAMTTHGHRFIGDLLFGSTISHVRHRATVPVLLVRAAK
ncbi:MAG: universal stress protein [Verrucomicrobia bacterium]|nr:universal stress protein [Verrucomicrobiota bacterium]